MCQEGLSVWRTYSDGGIAMIGFRVDANETIATGHLMRCMAIAKGFRNKGEEVIFFIAEEKETQRLIDQDMPYVILHSDWRKLEQELPGFKQVLKQYHVTKLIVDSYQATRYYLESLNQDVQTIYMDDMGTEINPIAGVIHYSNRAWDTSYEKGYENLDTVCMAGMQYTPLREEFYPNKDDPNEENANKTDQEKNILITTGGTDPYNIAGRLLEYVKTQMECQSDMETDMEKLCYHAHFLVISGSMNQNKPFLEKLAKENHWITLYENVNNMGNLMRDSDLAVSAGGTTLYELCACKVPTVCFSFADNQAGFTKEMGKQGMMCDAGDARGQGNICGAKDVREQGDIIKNIYQQLMKLWNDERLCGRYREKMGQIVDGKGVERIVEKIRVM